MNTSAALLLEGPRGRRFCLELAAALDEGIALAVFQQATRLEPSLRTVWTMIATDPGTADDRGVAASVEQLATDLDGLDLSDLDDQQLLAALMRSVDAAMPWQEPDGDDVLANLPPLRQALARLAERIGDSPFMHWCSRSRPNEQWAINWRSPDVPAPLSVDPREALNQWER